MNRFHGVVGYVSEREYPPGVYKQYKEERIYTGEIKRSARSWTYGDKQNADLNVSNQISIIADDYAVNHASEIKYVRWLGSDWNVTNFEIEHPRITLTLGGVYNANKVRTA